MVVVWGQTPLGTAFIYQGRLTDGGAPATGVDLDAVVTQIAGGGLGGGVLLFIVSLVRAMMNKAG